FTASGRSDDCDKSRCFQVLNQSLDIRFASEEQVGMLLLERLQPAIRTHRLNQRLRPLSLTNWCTPNGVYELSEGIRVVESSSEIDPGLRLEHRRQAGCRK